MDLLSTLQWTHHISLSSSSTPKYKFCHKTHEFIFNNGISMQRPVQLTKRMESLMMELREGCNELLQANSNHGGKLSSRSNTSSKSKKSKGDKKKLDVSDSSQKNTIRLHEMQGVVEALIRSTAEYLWFIENKYENSTTEISLLQQYVSMMRFLLRDIWHVHEAREEAMKCVFLEEASLSRADYLEIAALFDLLWNPDGAVVQEWKQVHCVELIAFHDKCVLARLGMRDEHDQADSTTELDSIPLDILIQYALESVSESLILRKHPHLKRQLLQAVRKYYACIKFRDPLSTKPLLTHFMESTRSDEIFQMSNFSMDDSASESIKPGEDTADPETRLSPLELKEQLEDYLRNGNIASHFPDENPNYFSLGFNRFTEINNILDDMLSDDLLLEAQMQNGSTNSAAQNAAHRERREFLQSLHKRLENHLNHVHGFNPKQQFRDIQEQIRELRKLLQETKHQLFNEDLEAKIEVQNVTDSLVNKIWSASQTGNHVLDELERLRMENVSLKDSQSTLEQKMQSSHNQDSDLRKQLESLSQQYQQMVEKYEGIITQHDTQLRDMSSHNDDTIEFMRNEYLNRLQDKDDMIASQKRHMEEMQRVHEQQRNELHQLLEKIHQHNLTAPRIHESTQTDHHVYLTKKELLEMRKKNGAVPVQDGVSEITVEEDERINLSKLRQVLIYKNE